MALTAETQRRRSTSWKTSRASTSTPALSGSPAALPSLLAFAKPGHVLFGSDWPYAPDVAVGYFTAQLDAYGALDADGPPGDRSTERGTLFPQFTTPTTKEVP
jgi:hypothetical protein